MVRNLPSKKAGKNPKDKTSMQVSWRLKDFVFTKSFPRESEEETIWRLIGQKETKEINEDKSDKLNTKKRKL